jgi:hypothetical protein
LLPNERDGDLLITDGKTRMLGMWHTRLGAGCAGGFGIVSVHRGRRTVTLVEGVTHWQRLPALPGAKVEAVDWPASRGTEHGEFMRFQVEAETDSNGID